MAVLDELRRMDEARFLAIYEALAQRGFGPLDGEVAKHLRFRPQAMKKLPLEKRARQARKLLEGRRNAELAYELFGSYLLRTRKELVTGFLDATGVEHEDGMIQGDARPDGDKVPEAVRTLDAEHPPEDVTLYLALAAENWPDVPAVQEAWSGRAAPAADADASG